MENENKSMSEHFEVFLNENIFFIIFLKKNNLYEDYIKYLDLYNFCKGFIDGCHDMSLHGIKLDKNIKDKKRKYLEKKDNCRNMIKKYERMYESYLDNGGNK